MSLFLTFAAVLVFFKPYVILVVASGKLDVVYEEAEIIICIQRQCMYSDQHTTKLQMSAIAAYGGLTVQTLSPMANR